MVIYKIEVGGIIECFYDSTNILKSVFDKNKNSLTVIFKEGRSYTYSDVKLTDYTRFEMSESQGKTFYKFIKNYKSNKNPDVDAKIILEEIVKIRTESTEK